jgi:hypothetical protein
LKFGTNIVLTLGIIAAGTFTTALGQTTYLSDKPLLRARLPLSDQGIKFLGLYAVTLGQDKLAANPKDPKGQMLLEFANHLIPANKKVLLLRGKLKFKVKINKPKQKVSDKEFLSLLNRARERIDDTNTAVNRHFLAILNQMIREFSPGDEEAIVSLMEFSDKGFEIDLKRLLAERLENISNVEFDPKDPRYIISDVKKTTNIPADRIWTDTYVKVKAGKTVKVSAQGTWSLGNKMKFPVCGANGYVGYEISQLIKKEKKGTVKERSARTTRRYLGSRKKHPGCLMAKIGTKEYYVGSNAEFKAENDGILYFGPYEWSDFTDNTGSLQVTFEITE